MLDDPMWIPGSTIKRRSCSQRWLQVVDGAWKAILEKTVGIDQGSKLFPRLWERGRDRKGRRGGRWLEISGSLRNR